MEKIINIWKFFKQICIHKWWVFYFCCRLGIPWQGLIHDLSKFSITEFWWNVKYYSDTRSPIDICKEKMGYSIAWQHHKGHNPHHYEYWMDDFDHGGKSLQIPFKYTIEMLADFLSAGIVYNKGDKDNLYISEYGWWQNKRKCCAMNRYNKRFFDIVFKLLNDKKFNDTDHIILDKDYLEVIYNDIENEINIKVTDEHFCIYDNGKFNTYQKLSYTKEFIDTILNIRKIFYMIHLSEEEYDRINNSTNWVKSIIQEVPFNENGDEPDIVSEVYKFTKDEYEIYLVWERYMTESTGYKYTLIIPYDRFIKDVEMNSDREKTEFVIESSYGNVIIS